MKIFTYHLVNIKHAEEATESNPIKTFTYHLVNIKPSTPM